jgi:hypothetical protein
LSGGSLDEWRAASQVELDAASRRKSKSARAARAWAFNSLTGMLAGLTMIVVGLVRHFG